MSLLGKAILAVWNEAAPGDEADFDEWYLREHIPERTSVPGMLRGRRYRSLEGGPHNMALYEARDLHVLTSGAYRTQLANPTDWTRRVTSKFRSMQRAICDVVATAGQGVGGYATVLQFRPAAGAEAQARAWLEQQVTALTSMKQISGAHAWISAEDEPDSPTIALSARAAGQRPVGWVLAIEATDLDALRAAQAAVLASDPAAHGAGGLTQLPLYQLAYVWAP